MNPPVNIDPLLGIPPTTDHKINEIYCIVSRGPEGEGIVSTNSPSGLVMQAVTSELRILEMIKAVFREAERPEGITLHVCRFTNREELEQL